MYHYCVNEKSVYSGPIKSVLVYARSYCRKQVLMTSSIQFSLRFQACTALKKLRVENLADSKCKWTGYSLLFVAWLMSSSPVRYRFHGFPLLWHGWSFSVAYFAVFGTDCLDSPARHWLHVFLHLTPVGYIFARLALRAATIHFPTIRYIARYKGHDTIHYCARQNKLPTTYTTFK